MPRRQACTVRKPAKASIRHLPLAKGEAAYHWSGFLRPTDTVPFQIIERKHPPPRGSLPRVFRRSGTDAALPHTDGAR